MSRFNGNLNQTSATQEIKESSIAKVKSSRILNNFSDITKFATWYGVTATSSTNALHVKNGSSSVKVVANSANGTQTALRNNNVSINLSKIKTVRYMIYVENVANVNAVELYFSNTTNYSDFGSIIIPNVELMNGWNELFVNTAKLTQNGAFTTNNLIKSIQIRVECVPTKSAVVYIDSLSSPEAKAKANVIFTFDDGWMSEYTNAFPMLLERGFVGNIGLVKNITGTQGYMSTAQAKEIYDYGWDMFNHTATHPDLTTLTKAQIKVELDSNKQWLNGLGLTRASDIVAYPYGGYNQNVIDVMSEGDYRLGRSIRESDVEMNCEYNAYNVRVRNMIYSFPASKLISAVDTAIQFGGTVVFLNHRIEATGTDSAIYSVENFKLVLDYVYSKRDEVNVITLSEWSKEIGK